MEEKLGIKEAKEALIGINELACLLAERLKDGIGVDDAFAILAKLQSDDDFKAKMQAAMDGIALVPAELKDIDMMEGLDMAICQIQMLPKLMAALKKA